MSCLVYTQPVCFQNKIELKRLPIFALDNKQQTEPKNNWNQSERPQASSSIMRVLNQGVLFDHFVIQSTPSTYKNTHTHAHT